MRPLTAVKKHCLACVGNVKSERDECENMTGIKYECLLHAFRFGENPKDQRLKLKTINKYCQWCMNSKTVSDCLDKTCNLYLYRLGHNIVKSNRGFKSQKP